MLRLRRLARDAGFRRAEGVFVIEGPKLVRAALDAGLPLEGVYVSEDARAAVVEQVVEQAVAAGVPVHRLRAEALDRAADAVTPQSVLAVGERVDVAVDRVPTGRILLVCVDLADPGNLGAVVRSAEATGAGAVICCQGTVDVYNPKCVRAAAGALFHLPVVAGGEPGQVLETLRRRGVRLLGAQAGGGLPPHDCDLTAPTAIVLGNEGHGLSREAMGALDGTISIPMAGRAESLNVAVAAGIICYEAARPSSGTRPIRSAVRDQGPTAGFRDE